jgi:release factor glutamine methyltransferase
MTAAQEVRSTSTTFGPLVVHYDARVLTPRPWTLMQSRWAAELAPRTAPGPMLELCAGAGQIGLAAAVLSRRRLVQVDSDPIAVGYAVANAALAGCADEVDVRHGMIDTVLAAGERFPMILADPPYVASSDIGAWPDDPPSAIDGGPDGLDLVRSCLRAARGHLVPGGVLLLQVAGGSQAETVASLLDLDAGAGLTVRETRHHDRDRAVMLLTAGWDPVRR